MFLVLRPASKLAQTESAFSAAKLAHCVLAPIDIEPLPAEPPSIAPELLIVTSTYAAEWLANHAAHLIPSETDRILTLGASTAAALQHQNKICSVFPPTSEGVLQDQRLHSPDQYKNVLICKGSGGRTLLKKTLDQRGFKVNELCVYRRVVLSHAIRSQHYEPEHIHCIMAASTDVIDATFGLLDPTWLREKHWVVPSERIAKHLKLYGISSVSLAANASNHGFIAAAHTYIKVRDKHHVGRQ